MKDFWVPQYKYQLVEFLTKIYGGKSKWNKMNKKRLYAIYFSLRNR